MATAVSRPVVSANVYVEPPLMRVQVSFPASVNPTTENVDVKDSLRVETLTIFHGPPNFNH